MKSREDIIKDVHREIIEQIENKINELEKIIEKSIKDEIKLRMEKDLSWYLKENTISEEELLDKVFELESQRINLANEINKLEIRKMVIEDFIAKIWEIQ